MRTSKTKSSKLRLETLPNETLDYLCEYLNVSSALWLSQQTICGDSARSQERLWLRLGFMNDCHDLLLQENNDEFVKNMQQRLMYQSRMIRGFHILSLPHQCLRFVPILPPVVLDFSDPPSVDWECDSCLLTTSTSGEMLFLDPFTGELSLWKDILEHTLEPIDGRSYPKALPIKPIRTARERSRTVHNERDVLIHPDEYFSLEGYFTHGSKTTSITPQSYYDISHHGIEIKYKLSKDSKRRVLGTFIALCRSIKSETKQECIEFISWFRSNLSSRDTIKSFGQQRRCRLRRSFHATDVCANRQCIYVNHVVSSEMGVDTVSGCSLVHCYPLVGASTQDLFTDPTYIIDIGVPVLTLAICALGDYLVVATVTGEIQVYYDAQLRWRLNVNNNYRAIYRTVHPLHVCSLHCPRGMPILESGVVALEHCQQGGLRLVLWRHVIMDDKASEWLPVSFINLPLSNHRVPQIHFDGRRIIVFGQDQFGMILLIYQVRFSGEDDMNDVEVGKEGSGGVYNMVEPCCVRFANRVRHESMSGLDFFDSAQMTVNERFIVINTKAGHLLHCSRYPSDGLLVFDLEEA